MRNLNRIIFINSANIPYADDIYLNGNVHFIGTQGVGKSTILRAILFFYMEDRRTFIERLRKKLQGERLRCLYERSDWYCSTSVLIRQKEQRESGFMPDPLLSCFFI